MRRVWKQRREYKPGGPLYARRRLVFSGVKVERGDLIPAALIRSELKHKRLWRSGQAGHEPRNAYVRKPYGKTSPAPTAPPAATVQPESFTAAAAALAAETPSAAIEAPTAEVAAVLDQVNALLDAPDAETLVEQVAKTTPAVRVESHRPKFKRR